MWNLTTKNGSKTRVKKTNIEEVVNDSNTKKIIYDFTQYTCGSSIETPKVIKKEDDIDKIN